MLARRLDCILLLPGIGRQLDMLGGFKDGCPRRQQSDGFGLF